LLVILISHKQNEKFIGEILTMTKLKTNVFLTSAVAALLILGTSVSIGANAPGGAATIPGTDLPAVNNAGRGDSFNHVLGDEQYARKQLALQAKLAGTASGKVHEVAKGQYVELERTGEDLIWTVMAEFGDTESPIGVLNSPVPGPQHNQIPEPDRTVDNSTIWQPDFSRDYYMDVLFSDAPGAVSMRNYYIEQSSNRYAVDGDVTDWGLVQYNTAHYGRFDSTVWWFVDESVDDWYNRKVADGWVQADFDNYLSQFDVWDRYDYDGDGNFDEPDGYIDHFQSVHSGEGEETGGGSYGSDAIWSHRWYAYYTNIGFDGPAYNPAGGVQIGDSGYWIGDYTVEPENGGVGVFAHEFAHDSGLPDAYNTAGGGDNPTGFWTIMSSGSYLNDGTTDIGSKPDDFNAWEKFQLGWLNYEVAFAGAKSEHKLGPAEANTKQAQGLFVVLPDKPVVEGVAPYSGDYMYHSGSGPDMDNFMYKSFNLAAGSSLSAAANVQIEADWDYAYVVVSTDGGTNWTSVETNLSTTTNPNGQNFGYGITGNSGGWVNLTADLSAYSGDVLVGFRYWTDPFVNDPGLFVDDVAISGYPLEDAESDTGWTYEGFSRSMSTSSTSYYFNAYVVEFRQYRGYDDGLRTGPYNFGFLDVAGNWVERFPYQDGLLISYWDTSFADNNTATHPGGGLILPIDAHPTALLTPGGNAWRARVQTYDSTFSNEPTDGLTLHLNSVPSVIPSLPGVSIFNDANSYWDPNAPLASVIVPQTGTTIRIKSVSAKGSFMQVGVNK
jgi:immune inhibitor A